MERKQTTNPADRAIARIKTAVGRLALLLGDEDPAIVDTAAMALGEIPVTLPYIKKKGLEALKENYSSSKDAADRLPGSIISFYQKTFPDLYEKRSQDIIQAAQAVLAVYNRTVCPDLKVTWGTYPNNLGHTDFPGCFRCHDGSHATAGNASITQDCNTCHEPLAMEETSPEILKSLGIAERISNVQKQ